MPTSISALPALIGHADVIKQLETLLAAGRLPHALLLHGPRGMGKRVLANQLAWRLIAGGQGMQVNQNSPAYHQLAAGSNPDFHVLEVEEKAKSIKIKQVRELLGNLLRTADTQRVVIVDSVDDLTDESPHVLLKTLEEPRPGLTFILISHGLGNVLPTIRSRSRLVRVGTLSATEQMLVRAANPSYAPPPEDDLVTLMHQLATNPTPENAMAYQKIATLRARQSSMNLPAALAAEAGRLLVK
ncbi:MAG TPA: AAA family ATPase [Alphaproteobacteria bacterium]|nr:AAA family ATPase [Alphaproteobacteria bacterium]